MIKNRFFKETIGIAAELVMAKSLDVSNTGATPQANYEGFRQNAVAGALGIFWEDNNVAVNAGETSAAANTASGRKFFYGYKMSDGTPKRTTGIPCNVRRYRSASYSAGVADVWTTTFGGTYQVGQTILFRFQDTTGGIIPYPTYSYEAVIKTTLANALTDLAASINGEISDKIASASATGTTITITCTDKNRTLKQLVPQLQTTNAQPIDGSAITVAHTTTAVFPLGTPADVLEFQNLFLVGQGNPIYYPEGTLPSDFYVSNSNADASVNYGYFVVSARRTELGQGSVHGVSKEMTTIICIATGALATLAAY